MNTSVIKENTVVTTALLFYIISAFFFTDYYMAHHQLSGEKFWKPHVVWDDSIPFMPEWVWIYILYFPTCILPIYWKEVWENKLIFRKTILGFLFVSGISYLFFLSLPSKIYRPEIIVNGLSTWVLSWIYTMDPGFNLFPSLHVGYVAYVASVAGYIKRNIISGLLWVLCLLIAASCLFLKQHYIIDLPAGLAVGITGYFLVFSKYVRP